MKGGTVVAILGLTLALLALLAGCKNSGGQGRVGVALEALDNPFFVAMEEGAEDAAGRAGRIWPTVAWGGL